MTDDAKLEPRTTEEHYVELGRHVPGTPKHYAAFLKFEQAVRAEAIAEHETGQESMLD
jgi:hypothetical protein